MVKNLRDILFDECCRASRSQGSTPAAGNAIVKDHASVDIKVALSRFPTPMPSGCRTSACAFS
jgi:hypothetical protein